MKAYENTKNCGLSIVALLLSICMVACTDVPRNCLENGVAKNSNVKEFHRVFPLVYDKVGYFHGVGSKLTWYSRSPLYDRYLVIMSFQVECDGELFRELSVPQITLMEYYNPGERISPAGVSATRGSLADLPISDFEWSKLSSAEDFFTLVKIQPIKDRPSKELLEIVRSLESSDGKR